MSERVSFFEQVQVQPEIVARFGDLHPAFDLQAAVPEANRCLFCFDAPCTGACPTHIDVPKFIKKIASGNLSGSAKTILEANVLGASCSRACPVEVLCEGACVMHRYNRQPIEIGRLQRFAMDAFHATGAGLPFEVGAETGKSVALIGAGPASLACAVELRKRGIRATIYDARKLPGGLNTYGIAEYKLPLLESLREIELVAGMGVEFRFGVTVDAAQLAEIEAGSDAVFLGMGLGAIHRLGIAGEEMAGVTNALDLIEGYKSGSITSVPARVAVIGAGNTAIDAAIAAVRLGAQEVTMVYRRGVEQMSAFGFEYEHAKAEGVRFLWYVQPVGLVGDEAVEGLRLGQLETSEDGSLLPVAGSEFSVPVEMVVMAIGQGTHTGFLAGAKVELERGRVLIDRVTGQTSHAKYFAGGDCTNGGREVVDAVADGKRAGLGIAAWLEGQHG
ncbi:NAD(P)-dependent oxidoreductase [Granulicella sibirica]|uniref:Pyridine nucleotide-disulfide oxidoreductase associated with reductive pyrimidine catabolism n=1 Tax=Granulicella sibirica TaxID=2479048 RepID=A0A4Q0T239_9BACT|nr:NAD(P)-dependent oxidoreductase [Granulicella sibirica]RXH56460.1 Pyridine nucleotide-disulfide oxidoreductase associated with reductive pyrimidine catabolism [Granulicella sibirica]